MLHVIESALQISCQELPRQTGFLIALKVLRVRVGATLSWNLFSSLSLICRCSAFAHKALLGLNFYGWEYSAAQPPEAILGDHFRRLLQLETADLQWDAAAGEHVLTYRHQGATHRVYYPSLKSMQERLQAAAASETGISIWELGQGLEYFFDLL